MNTKYFKNVIMGNIFQTSTGTPLPSTYYIGLSSTEPNDLGENVTEPRTAGTGYNRVKLDSLTTPDNGVISNAKAITFPESISDWFPPNSPAMYYVIYDSESKGNLLMYNQLVTSRIIEANTITSIKESSLYLQLAD